MLQNAGVFNILTCKCASRHSGVQFFDIKPPKSGPYPSVFPHFDLQICFAPQPRAIFEHRDTSKIGPRLLCFAHFDLQMCFAPQRRAIFHLSASTATSAPAALARLLFEHQEPRIIEKTQRFATSLTFFTRVPSFK